MVPDDRSIAGKLPSCGSRIKRLRHGVIAVAAAFGLCLCAALLAPLAGAEPAYSTAEADKYVRARDWNGLLDYAQNWTRARPDDPQAWFYLGQTFGVGLQRHGEAIAPIKRAVTLKPVWAQAWYFLGTDYVKTAQYREAADALRKATQQAPNNMTYWLQLGEAYGGLRDFDKAHELLDEARRVAGPTGNYADWANLALGYMTMYDYANAANAYRRSLKLNARTHEAWNNLGICEEQLGNFANALGDYRQAVRLGNDKAADNIQKLQVKIEVANMPHTAVPNAGPSSSGSSPGAPAATSCAYSSAAACNAASGGNYWSADRIENNRASGSEKSWYDR